LNPLSPSAMLLRICLFCLAAIVTGCADLTPRPGEVVTLQVYGVLDADRMRYGRRVDVGNALAQGISPQAIETGRLVVLICALAPEEENPEAKWVVLLPEGVTLRAGDVVSFRPGARFGREGPVGTMIGRVPSPPPETLYVWKYGKSVRCNTPLPGQAMQARYGFAFGRNDLKEYQLHRQRMQGIREDEVRSGRIVLASCSQLTDGWTEWTVRVPPGLGLRKGDHILARAGTPDAEPGSDISEALRRIPPPPVEQTYHVQGSRIVRCNAASAAP
jgi:hypothetical protein